MGNEQTMTTKLTTIAYYLGQYHPVEENNQFWGDGFTEWHNVAKARPLYFGHEQPKLPGTLGFYDLRCRDTIEQQIDYAKHVGIDAFCHWHYWFAGRRLLHGPLDTMIEVTHGVKLMLGWANESWTGVWHGSASNVLIEQSYNVEELDGHSTLVASYIESGRFLEVNGAYPFVIYKPRQIPDAVHYLSDFREAVKRKCGADLYIIGNWSPGRSGEISIPSEFGLDAVVITPVASYFQSSTAQNIYSGIWQSLRKIGVGPEMRSFSNVSTTLVRAIQNVKGIAHSTVVTGWDNTPRSGRRGLVLTGYTEDTFRSAATNALGLERENTTPLLFIKSWNEWAEGNVLEPAYKEAWSAGAVLKEVLNAENEKSIRAKKEVGEDFGLSRPKAV
jgi:Glycosyltransferase WbsX